MHPRSTALDAGSYELNCVRGERTADDRTSASTEARRASRPLNQCSDCGQGFNSVRLFDAHRAGRHAYLFSAARPDGRRCLSASEMLARGWEQNRQGRWSDPARARDVEARGVAGTAQSHDGVNRSGHAAGIPSQIPAQLASGNRDDPGAGVYTAEEIASR